MYEEDINMDVYQPLLSSRSKDTMGEEPTKTTHATTIIISDTFTTTTTTTTTTTRKLPLAVYQLAAFSAIGGFLFGYDTGVVSGAMILVRNEFKLTNLWHEVIVSGTIAAAWLFALIAGPCNDYFGRRKVILTASVIFTTGAVVMGAAPEKVTLLVGRIIVGMGIGLASMSVPMYLSEASPAQLRGRITVINNIFITGGQLAASLICGIFSNTHQGWRYMLGLAGVPSVVQLAGFSFLPESPRWLVGQGRNTEAYAVLKRIRGEGESEVQAELETMKSAVSEDNSQAGIRQVLKSVPVRRALMLGCLLQLFQQISGINTVMYYSASIITMAGVTDKSMAIWLAAATSSMNFLGTFLGLWLVERIGRRPLTLFSLAGTTVALVMLAVSFQLAYVYSPAVTSPDPSSPECFANSCGVCTGRSACGFCFQGDTEGSYNATCVPSNHAHYDELSVSGLCSNSSLVNSGEVTFAYDWCPYSYAWISIVALALYLLFFSPGMGPMPWTINSEIYPSWARATCTSITTSVNWAANLLVSLTFLTLTEVLLKHGTFYLYMCLAALGFLVFLVLLPETRGLALEDMEKLFKLPLRERIKK